MPNFTEHTDKLKKYTANKFKIFEKETGIKLGDNAYIEFLDKVGNELNESYNKNAFALGSINGIHEVNKAFGKYSKEYLTNALKESNDKRTPKYSKKEVDAIFNSWYKLIHSTNIAFGIDNKFTVGLNVLDYNRDKGCFKINDYKDIYKSVYGYDNHYDKVTQKYGNIKNKSATLCGRVDEILSKRDTPDNQKELAALYKTLQEKQKKNSIFTNWFNKRGYNERNAMKRIEAAFGDLLVSNDPAVIKNRINKLAKENVEQIVELENANKADNNVFNNKGKDPEIDKFNNFKKLGEKEEEQYLNNEVKDAQIMIMDENTTAKIEVNELNDDFVIGKMGPSFDQNEITIEKQQDGKELGE